MTTDTIADMLTRIRNAQERKKGAVEIPYSKMNESIAKVLVNCGYLKSVKSFKYKGKKFKGLSIELMYKEDGSPSIRRIDRISRPGLRKYVKARDIYPVLGGIGIYVISTPKGIMSSVEAKRKRLGGELLCRVY